MSAVDKILRTAGIVCLLASMTLVFVAFGFILVPTCLSIWENSLKEIVRSGLDRSWLWFYLAALVGVLGLNVVYFFNQNNFNDVLRKYLLSLAGAFLLILPWVIFFSSFYYLTIFGFPFVDINCSWDRSIGG